MPKDGKVTLNHHVYKQIVVKSGLVVESGQRKHFTHYCHIIHDDLLMTMLYDF